MLFVPFLFAWCHKATPWFSKGTNATCNPWSWAAPGCCAPTQGTSSLPKWSLDIPFKGWLARGNHQDLGQSFWASARSRSGCPCQYPRGRCPRSQGRCWLWLSVFLLFQLSYYKHSPATLVLKGSLSLPFLPFHRFKNTAADSPNVWNNWILHSNSSVKYSLIKLA